MKEGLEKGLKKGREEGREEEKYEIARKMRREGMSVELIAGITGLTVEEIRDL